MPVTGDGALGQILDVIPTTDTSPTVPTHLQGLLNAIEKRSVLRATSSGASVQASFDAAITGGAGAQENGMLGAILTGTYAGLYFRVAGAWVRVYGTDLVKVGTATPTASDVPEGGFYIKVDA